MGDQTQEPSVSSEEQNKEEEIAELREVMSAENCATCTNFGKGNHCFALHRDLTVEEFVGGMACEGERYNPVFTSHQVEDICNIWAHTHKEE